MEQRVSISISNGRPPTSAWYGRTSMNALDAAMFDALVAATSRGLPPKEQLPGGSIVRRRAGLCAGPTWGASPR